LTDRRNRRKVFRAIRALFERFLGLDSTLASEPDVFERATSLWHRLTHQPAPDLPGAAQATEENRRVWVRRHVSVETRITPTSGDGEPPVDARILDISSGGMKLMVRWAFGPGDLLTLELPARDGEPSVTVLACVAHSRAEGETEWVIGCRFSAEMSDADLAAFGASRTRSVTPDGRNWSRFACEVKAVYTVLGDDDEIRREAKVLNISAGGFAVVVDHDIQAGAILSAELHAPAGPTVVTILACVVHVTVEPDNTRTLGCNFIHHLSEDALQALA
jgi:c-di-GMP-binding flagellar brake protein YcgR